MLNTLNMLHAASECGVKRFVLTSSSEVYPLDSPVPTPESYPYNSLTDRPHDGYVWSKRMSELATTLFRHEYGIEVLTARPSNVYGPGEDFDSARGRVIPAFIRQALRNEPIVIWGTGEQVRSFLYVEDLARGILALAEKGANGGIVNFAGATSTIRGIAELVVALCGSSVEIRCEPDKPAGPSQRVFDCTQAERQLGFKPAVSLEEGVARTIAAYRRSVGGAAAGA
jgi:nucleoside-diphosphate-sugar epimerase